MHKNKTTLSFGSVVFLFYICPMKKVKQFGIIKYYRGIELNVVCVTTSKKKFAELLDTTVGEVKNYAYSYEPKTQECIDNPDTLYAEVGLGGEGTYVFERNKMLPYEEYKAMIDEHRKTYCTYRDYLEKTGKKFGS
jgi:hypothetical protein